MYNSVCSYMHNGHERNFASLDKIALTCSIIELASSKNSDAKQFMFIQPVQYCCAERVISRQEIYKAFRREDGAVNKFS